MNPFISKRVTMPYFFSQKIRVLMSCVLLGLFLLSSYANALEINIPRPESKLDSRSNYQIELLQLALDKAGVKASIKPAKEFLSQSDVVKVISQNTGQITVAWFMTTQEREEAMLPIRIPIDKGLIGWRIAIVKAELFDRFRNVHNVADLKKLTAVQERGWPDVAILRANGLRVQETDHYEDNFLKVSQLKNHYLPRSLIEYRNELDDHRELGLIEEPHMVIRYPAASYFFLPKSQTALADKIRNGLEMALLDGSFDRLFYAHHSKYIESAGLQRRNIVELKNPFLSKQTPLSRKKLWFRPETVKR